MISKVHTPYAYYLTRPISCTAVTDLIGTIRLKESLDSNTVTEEGGNHTGGNKVAFIRSLVMLNQVILKPIFNFLSLI